MWRKGNLYKSDYQILSFLRLLKILVFGSKTRFKSCKARFYAVEKNYNNRPKNTNFDPSR